MEQRVEPPLFQKSAQASGFLIDDMRYKCYDSCDRRIAFNMNVRLTSLREQSNRFLQNEILLLALLGGLQRSKIYREDATTIQRGKVRQHIMGELRKLNTIYKNSIPEERHIKRIVEFAKKVSDQFPDVLDKRRLRIGISQKLINLYLKYLWTLGWIEEPPHCPFDSIIINELRRRSGKQVRASIGQIRFTQMDSAEEYRKLVEAAKFVAEREGYNSIAAWELYTFERRRI